jgi:hypothetical protein
MRAQLQLHCGRRYIENYDAAVQILVFFLGDIEVLFVVD